ncbi:MAG: hypothetical protein AAF996_08925 [Pseudomonadota bacterium]
MSDEHPPKTPEDRSTDERLKDKYSRILSEPIPPRLQKLVQQLRAMEEDRTKD